MRFHTHSRGSFFVRRAGTFFTERRAFERVFVTRDFVAFGEVLGAASATPAAPSAITSAKDAVSRVRIFRFVMTESINKVRASLGGPERLSISSAQAQVRMPTPAVGCRVVPAADISRRGGKLNRSMGIRPTAAVVQGSLLLASGLALAGWLAAGALSAWLAPPALKVGALAPPLTAETTDGRTFDLHRSSKVVLLDFWRPDCVGCVGQTPILNRIFERYAGAIDIVAMTDAPVSDVEAFIARRDVRYPVAFDTSGSQTAWGVIAYPTLFIVDRDGRIAAVHKRGATEGHLVGQLDRLLTRKAADRTADRTANRTTDRTTDRTADRTADRTPARAAD